MLGDDVAQFSDPKTGRSPQATKIADLIRKRGSIKARITIFEKFVYKFENVPLNSQQNSEINLRVQSITNLYDDFNNIQSQIEELSKEQDLSKQFDERESFEQQYYQVLAFAKCLVKDSNAVSNMCSNNSNKFASVKLPDIKLPSFDGAYDQWLEFKNTYITMIHSRADLDPIQKFHYLRSSLSGTALQVISAFEFTATNYNHAWDLLENRFNNNRLLIHNHVKALFSIQSLNKESPVLLRKLIDTISRNLRALSSLGEPTESWDTLIIFLAVTKLDSSTEREWEEHKGSTNLNSQQDVKITLQYFLSFLKDRADVLEMLKASNTKYISDTKHTDINLNKKTFSKHQVHSYAQSNNYNNNYNLNTKHAKACPMCNALHPLYSCLKFLNLPVQDRIKTVDSKKLCRNCLRSGHSISECIYGPCRQCNNKHNTLLHINVQNENAFNAASSSHVSCTLPVKLDVATALHATDRSMNKEYSDKSLANYDSQSLVLLSTAVVNVRGSDNTFHKARILLDSGSQHCLVTKSFANKINAHLIQSTIQVMGVGRSVTQITHRCDIEIHSRTSNFYTHLQCLVLPSITNNMPPCRIDSKKIHIPTQLKLADPRFYEPSKIDILIGADTFWELFYEGVMRLPTGPYLHKTKLGWVVSGPLHNEMRYSKRVTCNLTSTLDTQLKRFWEIEEVPQVDTILTADERECEDIFKSTFKREKDGRFSVRIPFKEPPSVLGESYTLAEKRFFSLERKFSRSPELKSKYCDFMRIYEDLGHMTRIDSYSSPHYFLPHHGVINENSTTTRLRTVFDASAITTSGKSLNDIQYTGPTLQNDIFSILLRFRQYKYVACADIEKMYRQISIQNDQRNLQLILWREDPSEPLNIYRLNTVTYGTASAPYLSIRCLKQLIHDNHSIIDEHVSKIIDEDFFVDDLITGHDDHNTLLNICDQITSVLALGCFPLHKWLFNAGISLPNSCKQLSLDVNCPSKTLGLGWFNQCDELYFTTKLNFDTSNITKRYMLSIISQIYDPLGLLSPTIVRAKILLQKLWLSKLDWDCPVPDDVKQSWITFINTFHCLSNIRIPRHVIGLHTQYFQLHIFTDASQSAYGACAYVRTYSDNSPICMKLLCSKSKVAPLKPLTIPRLELCGSLIGAKLYRKIVQSMRIKFHEIYFWTDSNIVLGWLRMSPHLLKTFVQNRVTEINEITNGAHWRHIGSRDNPADLLSRGVDLDVLAECRLWWCGPDFLNEHNNSNWSENQYHHSENIDLPETKPQPIMCMSLNTNNTNSLIDFNRFSSFNRLKRSIAYVLRFIENARARYTRLTGSLSIDELNASVTLLTRLSQMESFHNEYNCLYNNLKLKPTKNISGLNIFLDKDKLIRIGGRLANCDSYNYNKKHPLLIDSKHNFTRLLFAFEHKRLCHAGPQLLLYTIRENWWPISGRNLARQTIRNCVICTRFKASTLTPIMGNLPRERAEAGFPFVKCGVDYAGPFLILNRRGRGSRLEKCYICLFVCFITRAVHLELVTSLTTDGYILALKRFLSRRGKPLEIYSDNGKNFVGTMKEFSNFLNNNSHFISEYAHDNNIQFKFIPPYAPHFGGLWEAGVKSCKYHLKRVVGNAHLTYEEFSTVLTQIEAVLNSRPISPMSSDAADLLPLTPAHFLIGRPMTAPADKDLMSTPTYQLPRYQRLEQLRQHFWARWSKEYVSELQTRTKWKQHNPDIKQDTLVLIKDDNLPPLKWRLGRIMEVSRGSDGVARVASIRTKDGIVKRAFSKICPLFQDHYREQ